jgi:hypothetical protein
VNHDVGWINGALAKFMAFHGTAWHSEVEFRAALRMPLGCFSGSSGLWFQHIYMMNTGIVMSSVTQRDPSKPSAEVVFQNWTQTRKGRCVHLPDKTIKWEIWRSHINIHKYHIDGWPLWVSKRICWLSCLKLSDLVAPQHTPKKSFMEDLAWEGHLWNTPEPKNPQIEQ